MSFEVSGEAYLRFMGRWSGPLAGSFLAYADLRHAARVLDVGCGPGVLTEVLVDRYGSSGVAAIDPSQPFVDATAARFPDADVRRGSAEALPFDDAVFDATLAQLVVHFMSDPVRGFAEMGRVTRSGGVVSACVWDHAGGGSPLSMIWDVVHELDPSAPGEGDLPGTSQGQLASYARDAGLTGITDSALSVSVRFASFDEWWAPYLLGVGPLGAYLATLPEDRLDAVRRRCEELLPAAPFEQGGSAWTVRALVP
jgi:SAM-dependent methyltransferase